MRFREQTPRPWLCSRSSTASTRSPASTTRAGSCRRRRSRFTCRSARRTRSACSTSRCRSASASRTRRPADWKLSTIGWVFSVAIVFLGLSAAVFGPWLERVGPRKAMFVVGAVLRRRIRGRGARRRDAPVLAAAARLRRARRHRPRTRLHLARLDAHQVVSRPTGHGDRHGDHGLRRRRDDRVAALDDAHGATSRPTTAPGVAPTFVDDGDSLLLLHDVRRVHRSRSAPGLAARGLDCRPERRRSAW